MLECWNAGMLELRNREQKKSVFRQYSIFNIQYSMPCGFTLLELLIVLVIISLTSVLVVPQLTGSLSRTNLQTASKKISASLRYARSQAASKKITHVAIFDFEKNRLSIVTGMTGMTGQEAQTGETLKEDLGDGEEPVIRSKSYDLPDGVKLEKAVSGEDEIDSGLFQIVFFPTGSSSGGDVILTNDRGKRYKISVDFITGIVQLESWDHKR